MSKARTAERASASAPDIGDRSSAPLCQIMTVRGGVLSEARVAEARGPTILVTVGLLCVVLGLSVIWRGDASESAAGFWPPAGVALVAMIVIPIRRWGWVMAGVLVPTAIGFAFDLMSPMAGGLWAVANCVEPAAAALTLRRFAASRWYTRGRLLAMFLLVAVVLAPMLGGAIGTLGTLSSYDKPWLDVWLEWVVGDGLGVLVVVPLLLSYTPRGLVRRTRGELLGLIVVVTTATGLAFADIGANGTALLPYLILAALVWAGMRFGTRSVAIAGFTVGLAMNIATANGLGPFAAIGTSADVITLPIFLAIALVTSFMVATMASELADRDQVHRLLAHQATHDALTGLPNRVLFAQRLELAMQTLPEGGLPPVVLMIDLDNFKKINDRHGHPDGDLALRTVADRLRSNLREGDVLARLGGDEFAVLSLGVSTPDQATVIAADLLRGLAQPINVGGGLQHQLSGSIGIAIQDGVNPVSQVELLRRADVALYHAKRTLGADISLFDAELDGHAQRRLDIYDELLGAVDRGEISVVYQPVVSLASGRPVEFEALARWTNPRLGTVPPDEFIAVAEDTGLIGKLGDWVLERACKQASAWHASSDSPESARIRIAVNVSARQMSDFDFPRRVGTILASARLPADALTLEITETAVMDDLAASERVLADLRAMGVRLSMDDFGTGYSSMSNLRRIPLHALKIDRSFVAGLGVVSGDTAIVEASVKLAHSFGLVVVAEGIETTWQMQSLVKLGCDLGQGFLWSKPVDGHEAASLLGHNFLLASAEAASIPGSFLARAR